MAGAQTVNSALVIALEPGQAQGGGGRLYSLCFFDRGWTVPQIEFLEADSDQVALSLATAMKPWMTREIWDRHRLVHVLPPTVELERL